MVFNFLHQVFIWTMGVLMHLLAWLLPLAFLNREVDKIRGWCPLAAFAVAGVSTHVLMCTAKPHT
jgi:hypothetical protein